MILNIITTVRHIYSKLISKAILNYQLSNFKIVLKKPPHISEDWYTGSFEQGCLRGGVYTTGVCRIGRAFPRFHMNPINKTTTKINILRYFDRFTKLWRQQLYLKYILNAYTYLSIKAAPLFIFYCLVITTFLKRFFVQLECIPRLVSRSRLIFSNSHINQPKIQIFLNKIYNFQQRRFAIYFISLSVRL